MKKKYIFLLITVITIALFGVTYAWFNYTGTGVNNELLAADIRLNYGVTGNAINISPIFPESKEEARSRNDNYITFTISGKNTTDKNVYYEIFLLEGSDRESPYERFNPKDLVFDLVEVTEENNEEVETYLLDAVSYDTLNNRKIWVDTVLHDTNTEIERTFKLRMWLSDRVIISDTAPNRDYEAENYRYHYASVRVGVYGDLKEKSLPSSATTRESFVENGKSYFLTNLTNDYLLEEEGELLDENDIVTLEITNPDEKLYFSYVDSKGNENTSQNESLTLTYTYNRNETVNIKVFTESRNDSNVNTTLHFKITKNGEIVQEYNKEIFVLGNNYCLNNGFTKLSDCILVTENLSNTVNNAKAFINSKGSPNVNVTAPTYNYVEKETTDSSITGTTLTTKWYFADSYTFNTTTGTYSLANSNGNAVNSANNQHELSEDYIGYYTFGSNSTTSGNTISRVKTVDVENNSITTSSRTYQISSSFDSEQGLYKVIDDYGDSYIFRGNVTNNNVAFGGYYWKILRINGDGSIRLIFNGNSTTAIGINTIVSTSKDSGVGSTYYYNTMFVGPTYVGYMPSINYNLNETSSVVHSGISSSTQYYFADDYKIVFDNNGPLFQLISRNNPMVKKTLSEMQNSGAISNTQYTCLSTNEKGTCQSIYAVSAINSDTSFTAKTYTIDLQMQIALNIARSNITASTVYYWGDDYELTYDANGPLFKLKKNQYDIVGKTVGEMKDDSEQFAKTSYVCGTTADEGCRNLHKVTSITSATAYRGDRYHFSPSSKEDSEKNQFDSTAKKALDTWYETKFMNNLNNGKTVTDYIVDGTFCNDRNITRTTDYNSGYVVTTHTYFAPRSRLIDTTSPNIIATLQCTNINDKFSVTSAYGNAKLTYPVALITADEVALAGGKYNEKNENFYLRTNGYFFTMSPADFISTAGNVHVFHVSPTGPLSISSSVTNKFGLRAVINLKADTYISSGDGTATNPYIIE